MDTRTDAPMPPARNAEAEAAAPLAGAAAPAPRDDAAPQPVVDIKKLWTAFGQGRDQYVVHQDLDLRIDQGEVVSLVGGSGTGKTVLLRQILGLEEPTRGDISVLGKPPEALGGKGASSRVGMLFQHGALYSAFNVLENIAFPLRELKTLPHDVVRDAALVKLQMVGLKREHATRMPADLSGGMIKRVALARALIMDPPLLLLDEPTAGLDPESSDEFCDLLRALHRDLGLTVIMVTHDLDTIFSLSTRVAVLADKKVIVNGPPREVAQFNHPFIRHYFLGERGRRAMAPVQPAPKSPSDDNAPAASAPAAGGAEAPSPQKES